MTRKEAIEELKKALEYNESWRGFNDYIPISEEATELALEALEKESCEDKENRNARIIYDFLKIKIGSKIIDNPFEFEDWYNRMTWHVLECYKLQKKYKDGEIAESKRGKWIVDRYCSECEWDKQEASYTSGWRENYCPNCGARMDGDEE